MSTRRFAALGASLAAAALTLSACGGGFEEPTTAPGESSAAGESQAANDNEVSVLIGSSGDAETAAVKSAVAAWSAESGVPAEVIVASDLVQQASQGFAAGTPADVLYVSTDAFTGWAKNGSLLAYGDELSNKDDSTPACAMRSPTRTSSTAHPRTSPRSR